MIGVLEKFLACDPNAFPTLRVTARAATGVRDIFESGTTGLVLRHRLKVWVKKTWQRVSEITTLQRLARLVSEVKKTPSSTSAL